MTALRKACIVGWPAGHSRSPMIHNYWIRQHGIAGEYGREAIPPEQFPGFLRNLSARGYVGANVTLPHKEVALELSEPDERALAVGAANTLWLDGGKLRSTNTDVEGFLANLDAAAPGWQKATRALVLGAGGGARAVVFGLLDRGFERVDVINRNLDRAQALAARFGNRVHAGAWDAAASLLPKAGLLVNTTSLGMQGQPPLAFELEGLSPGAVVADLVYVPLATPLLQAAGARGHHTADGLGMLLHQAVRGFALWFGITPAVTAELRALIEADLLAKT